MTSTELKIGIASSTRPSSRVLKPPGGGHSNIFAEPEVSVNAPRPKYNQQNSSNLNACMGSIDPNKVVEKMREELTHPKDEPAGEGANANNEQTQQNNAHSGNGGRANGNANDAQAAQQRGRVPPGGYSSGGFW